ncbi:MAG: 4Fe-4S binding protein [Dethiobacter sp.]|jgi:NAD-dependent dihydropyrimidine dehydrogenase PreA subunit|nr:4Fe-4S binding protein [Dethiobacter sp.]
MTVQAYEKLAEKMGFSDSKRLIAVLEHSMSSEQAVIADALPGSPAEVAEKTGVAVETVKAELEDLFFKGVVFPRGSLDKRENYRFAREIIQLHDAVQASGQLDPKKDKRLFELWHDFCINEMYPHLVHFSKALPQAPARVIPAYEAIKGLPDVQPWENFKEILKAQSLIAVTPCSCRFRTTAIEEHCDYCDEVGEWKCIQFGKGAQYVIERGSGRQISLDEALKLADKAEEEALVHIGAYDNNMHFNTSCQCCKDCCEMFVAMNENDGDLSRIYAKSRFAAFVAEEDCNGCQNCLERCQFDAIDMVRSGKKYKAVVDLEKCYGCGVCVLKCDTGALTFKAIHPPEYIPAKKG